MTDTNPRDLIRRLTEKLDHLHCYYNVPDQSALIAEARAYLDQPEPEPDDPDYFLAWILFACDGKLRPEAQRVLAAYGISQPEPERPTDEELQRRFLTWWNEEGSAMRPLPGHDYEEHARRISEIAWANGAYVARWGRSPQ
jgi:hypothetical protein